MGTQDNKANNAESKCTFEFDGWQFIKMMQNEALDIKHVDIGILADAIPGDIIGTLSWLLGVLVKNVMECGEFNIHLLPLLAFSELLKLTAKKKHHGIVWSDLNIDGWSKEDEDLVADFMVAAMHGEYDRETGRAAIASLPDHVQGHVRQMLSRSVGAMYTPAVKFFPSLPISKEGVAEAELVW